ncbi:MAG: thioredoxin family protein [Elusimicrobia bacterium]|nr:thioredoxin family protein [Elusimicrobiota bacterium]
MKRCPACGAGNPRDAEHCGHCPASFPRESALPPPPASTGAAMRARLPHVPPWGWALIAAAAGLLFYESRPAPAPASSSGASAAFDASRDADRDLADGLARAKVTNRRVLVDVGGNWCLWCRRMDEFFAAHADLAELRDANFVVVRVSVTPERPNAAVLSRFPAVESYPHFFVLEPDGTLVFSKDTGELEDGVSYDPVRVAGFLKSFAPPR